MLSEQSASVTQNSSEPKVNYFQSEIEESIEWHTIVYLLPTHSLHDEHHVGK